MTSVYCPSVRRRATSPLGTPNCSWSERTDRLGWQTASTAWRTRAPLSADRSELKEEVEQLKVKLEQKREARAWCSGTANRLAIEVALKRRGLLSVVQGGWC